LHPAETGGDDEGLAKRMRMPGSASAGFESDAARIQAHRFTDLKDRFNADRAAKIILRPFVDGREPLRSIFIVVFLSIGCAIGWERADRNPTNTANPPTRRGRCLRVTSKQVGPWSIGHPPSSH